MDSTILDSFTSLANNNEKLRLEAGVKLVEHVFGKQAKFEGEGICPELLYTLNRLIRGVASSRVNARKGFYIALVGLLSTFSFVTVEDVLAVLKKELHSATNTSKSEEADISAGHILVHGALIRSGLLFKGTIEEQTEVFNSLLENGSKRSYLLLPSHTFIVTLLNKIEEQTFRDCIWPVVRSTIKPLPEMNLETLHLLLLSRTLYPDIVKKKFLLNHIGTPEVINEESLQTCAKLLMTVRNFSDFHHPVHEEFCKQLAKSSLVSSFWELGVERELEKSSESKKYIAVEMFHYVLKHMDVKTEVPNMLTPRFLDMVVKSLEKLSKKLVAKNDRVCGKTHEVFVFFMVTALKDENVKDKTVVKIIKRLSFGCGGDLMFDRVTGTKVVQNLLSLLKSRGVKKVAEMVKEVISGTTGKKGGLDGEEPRPWSNKERMYATDLFARILGLSAVVGDVEWKIEQVKFLLVKGFFYPPNQEQNLIPVGGLLADTLKQSFFRVLNQRLSKMEDIRVLLNSLMLQVDEMIAGGEFMLRLPLAREALDEWQKLIAISARLEQKVAAGSNVMLARVFHTMFLYMGLQLLADPKLARDALQELHGCYERVEKEQKEKQERKKRNRENEVKEEREPMWVEVAVDLILSLLSQSSSIPKNMLDMFFFHLCPHLTGPALGQITQVLDPTIEDNPLTKLWSKESDDSSENDDSGEESNDSANEGTDIEESESDLEEAENETVNDKLRMAVREALGSAAPQTDTESVDIDEMDEEEGRRLDRALSEAFSMLKGSKTNKKSKKQLKDDRILMHFRIRAVDLLEIYLKSEHVGTEASLASYIDIMLVLFGLLEFCIRDLHQKPLENRVRSCLKRLSSAKKNISVEGVTEGMIADALKRLMEKGEKTSGPIFLDMGPKVTECCSFLVRCSQRLKQQATPSHKEHKKKSPIVEIYKNALTMFFTKRDCLHQPGLFRSVLESMWDGSWTLVPLLVCFAFDPEVRPFRRNQALDLLAAFFRNRRLRTVPELTPNVEPRLAEIEKLLSENTIKWLKSQVTDSSEDGKIDMGRGVKQKFVRQLLTLLFAVWHSYSPERKGGPNVDWTSLGTALLSYRENVDLSADAKTSFNKLTRILDIKWVPVQKEKKQPSKNDLSDSNESCDDHEKNENVMDVDSDGNESEKGGGDVRHKAKNKQKKKEKKSKQKKNAKNKTKLKKEARELRLASLSQGLENVTFTSLRRNIEAESESDEDKTDVNKTNSAKFVNSDNNNARKVPKRKLDESGDNIRTKKKSVK